MHSSETRHWNKLPVPLKWLCGLDELPAENALANAFGDRYLCRNNPVFRGVMFSGHRRMSRFSGGPRDAEELSNSALAV